MKLFKLVYIKFILHFFQCNAMCIRPETRLIMEQQRADRYVTPFKAPSLYPLVVSPAKTAILGNPLHFVGVLRIASQI